jgi:hypothetical protein
VPITPTTLPAFTPQCFIGEYVVTPAHRIGAATSGRKPSGIFSTKSSRTTSTLE